MATKRKSQKAPKPAAIVVDFDQRFPYEPPKELAIFGQRFAVETDSAAYMVRMAQLSKGMIGMRRQILEVQSQVEALEPLGKEYDALLEKQESLAAEGKKLPVKDQKRLEELSHVPIELEDLAMQANVIGAEGDWQIQVGQIIAAIPGLKAHRNKLERLSAEQLEWIAEELALNDVFEEDEAETDAEEPDEKPPDTPESLAAEEAKLEGES